VNLCCKIHIVNFSGGKDSTAMLLRMIELGEKIDYIVFADTGYEFPLLYDYISMIEKRIGREIKILKPSSSFDSWRFGKLSRGKNKGEIRGFPQVITPCYWMREAKFKSIQDFCKKFPHKVNYLGIASDEKDRVQKDDSLRYPLIEWGWSEEDCIDYLQKHDLMNDLYNHFSRIGCWMCPKQSDYSKYMLWKHYRYLWDKLREMEQENLRDTNRGIFIKSISSYDKFFEQGGSYKDKGKICFECKGIRLLHTKQLSIGDFE